MTSLNDISKYLSYILRHKSEEIGLILDAEGWANIEELIEKSAPIKTTKLTTEILLDVVKNNDKKRFQISEDGLSIRAVQGHSNNAVNITFQEKMPPEFLYHGTATRFLEQILQQGLKPQSRQYVHLSADQTTAETVGKRYGKPHILTIESEKMFKDGFKFYQAENGVWLISHVPTQYLVS